MNQLLTSHKTLPGMLSQTNRLLVIVDAYLLSGDLSRMPKQVLPHYGKMSLPKLL